MLLDHQHTANVFLFFFLDGLRPLQRCLYDYRGAGSRQADASSPDSWPRPYGAYGNAHASWVQCVALTSPAGTFLFYRYHSFSTTMALSSPGKSREKKKLIYSYTIHFSGIRSRHGEKRETTTLSSISMRNRPCVDVPMTATLDSASALFGN